MIFWIDAQLSPALAPWLSERFQVQAFSLKHLGFRDALDREIFLAAKEAVTPPMLSSRGSWIVAFLRPYASWPRAKLWSRSVNLCKTKTVSEMKSLKKDVLALILTAAALASTASAQAVWCPTGTMYCECQGYVYCSYDCLMACEP